MTTSSPTAVIVLAAGEGTRMKSSIPKVLHRAAGRSLLSHVLHAAAAVEPAHTVVVVRAGRDSVAAEALNVCPDAVIADQDDIPGTGRAVSCALHALHAAAGVIDGPIVVLNSDCPMLDGGTLTQLMNAHVSDVNAVTVLTTVLQDPTGYGRIVRGVDGQVEKIVEHRDATIEQRSIQEVNAGMYVFDGRILRNALDEVGSSNDQHEVYLTDVIGVARQAGEAVRAVIVDDPWTVEGVNDRVQLSVIVKEMNRRIIQEAQLSGVTVADPATTWVDVDVELEQDVVLLPGTYLGGQTKIASGAFIGPDSALIDCTVGPGAVVERTKATESVIGAHANVGPFSYLRPGTILGDGGKIGAYVETKKAVIGKGTKVPHLSYVGDAEIGEGTNIGAATIFANYDGVNKHPSVVGSHVKIGSQSLLVAPVHIGDGVYTAAGSVIREDVPSGSLALLPGRQRVIEGWVERKRPGTPSADAAARAQGTSSSSQSNPPHEGAGQ